MSQFSPSKKPTWIAGVTYNEADVVATTGGWVYQPTNEILVAIPNMLVKIANQNTDAATPPTFTYLGPVAGNYVTGAKLTFTLTPNEPVTVVGAPRLTLTIGAATKYATYDAVNSTSTSLIFTYTIVAEDVDADGIVVAATLDKNGGTVSDNLAYGGKTLIAGDITYTVPATVITIN